MGLTFRLAIFALVLCGGSAHADEFKIGVIAPTTGPAATVGTRQLSTLQWWERETNASGGIRGKTIRLMTCNDEANPEKAASCGRDLIAQKAVLILNCSVTGAIRATIPLVEHGPVMLTPAPGVVPPPTGYVFQTSPSDTSLTDRKSTRLNSSHSS